MKIVIEISDEESSEKLLWLLNNLKDKGLEIIPEMNVIDSLDSKINKLDDFSIENFIGSIFDSYFLIEEEYVNLLVNEIPEEKLEEVFYQLAIQLHSKTEFYNIVTFTEFNRANFLGKKVLERLTKERRSKLASLVTKDIRILNITYELFFKTYLFLEDWNYFDEVSKLRIRNILISFINEKEYPFFRYEILLKGWEYFDEDTKKIITDGLTVNEYLSEYSINEDGNIEYNEKKVTSEIDSNYEIPF